MKLKVDFHYVNMTDLEKQSFEKRINKVVDHRIKIMRHIKHAIGYADMTADEQKLYDKIHRQYITVVNLRDKEFADKFYQEKIDENFNVLQLEDK